MNPTTKENLRKRVRAIAGKVDDLAMKVDTAYTGRNAKLRDEVIAPAVTQLQDLFTKLKQHVGEVHANFTAELQRIEAKIDAAMPKPEVEPASE